MKKGTELKQHFHTCMPLFIALGDEIRLDDHRSADGRSPHGTQKKQPYEHKSAG